MSQPANPIARYWIAAIAAMLLANPVLADKHGKGHGGKHRQAEHQPSERHHEQQAHGEPYARGFDREPFFNDQHRQIFRDYYVESYRSGHCPPGLAKKHNGCLPPGQAKRWSIGRPLPRDVIYYDLPPSVLGRIGTPPPGYRFVRVASDILMIAIGSGLVMDAIADLNAMP